MYDHESETYIGAAYQAMSPFPVSPYDWNPNVARFFPFKNRQAIWDMCGYLWHQYYHVNCQACMYGYGGHQAGLDRGRRLLPFIAS